MADFLQLIVVGALVALAAAYLTRATWRTWFSSKSGCNKGCGCGSDSSGTGNVTIIPVDQLSVRGADSRRNGASQY